MRQKQDQKQKDERSSTFEPTAGSASRLISPLDIQQKEFRVSRLGGYRMRDVDEFLDTLTDAMSAVLEENERLRGAAGPGGVPIVGTPDLDEVGRQADEIVQRARDEAARVLAEARERAPRSAGDSAIGAVGPGDRQAVDAFLTQERAFLQSLAGLVQEHADTVKGMVRQVRKQAAPPATRSPAAAASAPSRGPGPAAIPQAPDTEGYATAEMPRVRGARPDDDGPIVVEQPQPASARREDPGADGDPDLRELFWGEES